MRTRNKWSRRKTVRKTFWLLATMAIMLMCAQQVLASTAANTNITNTVTVTFDDAANNPQTAVTATTTVTVTLVAAAPTLNSPLGIDPTTENTLNTLTYIISSNANGPDTYDLSQVSVDDANLSAPAMVNNATFNPLPLGGTTLVTALTGGELSITVPYDGTSDGVVNGLVNNAWFVIGADPDAYQIAGIVEDNVANTATLTLNAATPIANAAAVGTIVGQQVTFTLDVTTGNLSSGTSGNHTVTLTATSVADNTEVTSQATPTVITVRRPQLTVGKFVRNVSQPAMTGTGTPANDGTNDYWPTGITGQPGDILAYMIVVTNPAGSGTANDVIIQDPIPMYTNYIAGSMQLDPGTGTFAAVTDAEGDGDAGEYDPTSGAEEVWIYAGSGGDCGSVANTSGDGTGGALAGPVAADVETRGIFHVEIQP